MLLVLIEIFSSVLDFKPENPVPLVDAFPLPPSRRITESNKNVAFISSPETNGKTSVPLVRMKEITYADITLY